MCFIIICLLTNGSMQLTTRPTHLAPPAQHDGWVLPAPRNDALPIWGLADGIRVGHWPARGPRGLIRIYAPYLENPPDQVINFIAVEPIVGGRRGLSEMEHSDLDQTRGKRMWTTDDFPIDPQPQPAMWPARGKFIDIDGVQALSFYVVVEPFRSGARPIIQVILRKDRPHEVAFRVFSAANGAKLDACILSATMGNYARLRRLHLKDRVVDASQLWRDFAAKEPGFEGFAPHAEWGIDDMTIRDGVAEVAATPDEADPANAKYAPDTPDWWRYRGKPARQCWRAAASKDLVVRVNGRRVFWGTRIEIPGGVAFENFEMQSPFEPGQEFVFRVEPVEAGQGD